MAVNEPCIGALAHLCHSAPSIARNCARTPEQVAARAAAIFSTLSEGWRW
ncbi:hypothetical protein [Geopseudomonas aromaticivorans]